MFPYFCLLLIPLLAQILLRLGNFRIRIGQRERNATWDTVALPLFFILYLLLLALRNETIGRDLKTYKFLFKLWGNESLRDIFANLQDCLYHFYCWLIYNYISRNYQVFIAITAILSALPIAHVYNQDKSYGYMKAAVFVNMSTFIMLFSGIRQGLAIALGVLAYQALKENKRLKFLIWTIIAAFVHHTGFIILLFYPVYFLRLQKKDLLWLVPVAALFIAYNKQIFNFISGLIGMVSSEYGDQAGHTDAIGTFLMFLLFTVFSYVVMDEAKMDAEAFALRNLLVLATLLQSFASVHALAMRMNYYFIILVPAALGRSMECAGKRYVQVAKAAEIVISVFFSGLFFYSTYRSYLTGISMLDTIPYIPFWKG